MANMESLLSRSIVVVIFLYSLANPLVDACVGPSTKDMSIYFLIANAVNRPSQHARSRFTAKKAV